ncbi:MAG: PQQ-dependent sugar dehydrogenase [Bryobacteraceae bacterium]|nr:PQQ-dependent sugar dehydrogenase [Bryobacteraceae bacterium]MDW8378308.1 PQQ-dependent sugar dehydrogenase [Bryobacterales bacterium]
MPTRFFSSVISTSVFIFAGSAFGQDHPSSVLRGSKRFQQTVVTSGLGGPWELTWGPDGMLWVTERTGKRITRVDPQTGSRKVAAELIEVSAPGGQDGLLGMALHPDLLRGKGNDFVYVAYTYQDRAKGPDPNIKDPKDPYRYLYMKVVRLTYDAKSEKLLNPANLLTGLPAGNDHNAGRLKFGPDHKLYLTLGDQGHNQLGNFCLPIESQRLPTQKEVQSKDYSAYVGKTLRINLDGSIPADNPKLDGVVSHVFTYGHRNPQGLDFAPDGTLYSSEHGPKTDDEINILRAGANYGWPHVAGLRDGKAYEYARWAEASTPCSKLRFSDIVIHPSVPRESEWAFQKPFVEPIATLFTVPSNYNFQDPACRGVDFVCWPTVGVSSMEYYESKRYASGGIPGWDKVLLVTTLKRGSIYVAELTPDGKKVKSPISRYFQSENRMRDTAVHPDGRTIYVATDAEGLVERLQGGFTTRMQNPGAILAFRYEREAKPGEPLEPFPSSVSEAGQASESLEANNRASEPLRFSAQQAQAGKTAYNASCAVCHGSTMTNGTFGTPLAGEYFRKKWSGRNVHALFQKAKTMPPAAPASLSDETYVNILAYIFEVNGFKAGKTRLPAQPAALEALAIR